MFKTNEFGARSVIEEDLCSSSDFHHQHLLVFILVLEY